MRPLRPPLRPPLRRALRSGSGKGVLAATRERGAAMLLLLVVLLLGALDVVIAGTYRLGLMMLMLMMMAVLLVLGLRAAIKERYILAIGAARHGRSFVGLAEWVGRGLAVGQASI